MEEARKLGTMMEEDDETGKFMKEEEDKVNLDNSDGNIIQGEGSSCTELRPWMAEALVHLRNKVQDAIQGNYMLGSNMDEENRNEMEFNKANFKAREDIGEISLWGIPLLPSEGHEGTNVILLKLLRANGFRVTDAFEMLRRTLKWRKDFRIEGLQEEIFEPDLENLAQLESTDKKGHLVCYMFYGAFRNKDLYLNTFGTQEKCQEFLRWRVKVMERDVQKLAFQTGGMNSMVQIIDLKNSPTHASKELRGTCKRAILLIHDNYPDIIMKTVFVNVPLWYYAYHTVYSRFLTHRCRSKFIFARPSSSTKTLLKFIDPEKLPIQYGGFKREEDDEFTPEHKVSEMSVKGGDIQSIHIAVSEPGVTVVWDVMVVGTDVNYKEEFIPEDEGSYRILLQKEKKLVATVRNSFYISEPGMILLTINNGTYKKKRVLYRLKMKPTLPIYMK